MIALTFDTTSVGCALRVVRALGVHRYVAGRLHLLHALALAAMPDDAGGTLPECVAWAKRTLDDPGIDVASRDEALWRRVSDTELAAVLEAFWMPGDRATAARDTLRALLDRCELVDDGHVPFDESTEEDMHPLLIDAGWELVPLSGLEADRHAGAISSFGDALAFESARFEEDTAIPSTTPLYELPAIGPSELLRGVDAAGALTQPLVVWAQGNATYLDYVIRGVRRAAKV